MILRLVARCLGRRAVAVAVVLPAVLAVAGCAPLRPANVVLVTLDTTRADFLGCYGKESARTPNLDRLAAGGILFEQTMASNPVTQASHSTILTGTYPMAHGVRDNILFKLAEERETLAEMLSANGFATAAAVGGFPLVASFGSAQGFDFYDDDLDASKEDARGRPARRQQSTWYDERPAGQVNDAIRPWLREHLATRPDQPFFIWLHYWDPHEPHTAPPPYGQLFAHDPYQGEIAYADQSLGELLQEIEERGEIERTLVVVTADHGEGRMEHDEMTHAFLAYETCLHVPLIISGPGIEPGRRIASRVGTVDIVPTVLDFLGIDIPRAVQGRSLAPLLRGETADLPPRSYYAESLSPRMTHGFGELRVLYSGNHKYIHGPRPELFDLASDHLELNDLTAERNELAAEMRAELEATIDALSRPEEAAEAAHRVDDETRRRLEALGYISMAGDEAPHSTIESLSTDGAPPQDRVGDINLEGRLRQQLSAGSYRLARQTALRLLEPVPDHDFFRGQLVWALLGLGELDEGLEVVNSTHSISSANLAPFLALSKRLFEEDRTEEGMAVAVRLTTAEPTVDGLLLLARIQTEAADPAVDTTIGQALEIDPDHPGARREQARRLAEAGDPLAAEDLLLEILTERPHDVEAGLMYADILAADGRIEQAIARLERLERIAPQSCDVLLELVGVLAENGRSVEAAEVFERMHKRCRDSEIVARAAAFLEEEGR